MKDVLEDLAEAGESNKLMFPMMALLAGALGGVFGIGGGMLISPLLLQVGISPEVRIQQSHMYILNLQNSQRFVKKLVTVKFY